MRSSHSNGLLQHPLLVPLLLIAAVLAVYYPAMSGGIHSMDDPGIVSFYSSNPPLSRILLPGSGYYYRPIIELSFWLDNRLWGMEPSVLHLENMLIHTVNVLLVFLLARRISRFYPEASPALPLFAALLFALHPLNVEAVGWIAGRTDPLAALFILSACLFLLRWLDRPRWRFALLSASLFLCALLTKETAAAFVPVTVLLIMGWPASPGSASRRVRLAVSGALAASACLLLVAAAALLNRSGSLAGLLSKGEAGVAQSAREALTAYGFYLKKLLLPLPLNFAITEVSPWYGAVAVVGAVTFYLMLRRGQPVLFLASAAMMILPSLVLVLRDISWTPYAERYMYLPTAFLSLGLCSVLCKQQRNAVRKSLPFLLLVLVVAAVISRQRTVLWQDQYSFYQDAIEKSPRFGTLYNELGTLLLQRNEVQRAAEAFAMADSLNTRPSMKGPIKANVMAAMVAIGDHEAAISYFHQLFGSKREAPAVFLESLQVAESARLKHLSPSGSAAASQDIMETFALLYEKTKEPFWLYQGGKMARGIGSHREARELFLKAYAEAPADAHYRLAARKQLLSLERITW